MKSPFPGMDPYLENHWGDVHASLVIYARDQLNEQLSGKLIARVEERLVGENGDSRARSIYPDVRIKEKAGTAESGGVAEMEETTATEPMIIHYNSEPATETFINIMEPGTPDRLVTVIEFLSLSNKLMGEERIKYKEKQVELKRAKVSLVEIDLLRDGPRIFALPAMHIPRKVWTTYQVCVRRGWKPEYFEIYPVPLRAPLPSIRIPLREKDEDVRLHLQPLVDQAYRKGRYDATINYSQPPGPLLLGSDASWAKALLKQWGKRQA